jgi:hypothetical protein
MSFKRIVPRALAAFALAIAILAPDAEVPAQSPPNLPPTGTYQSIPNFTGVGAGALFRQAINQRFSGAQPVSPTIANVTFASLPTELDGMMIFCSNCKLTNPCTASGNGAWAVGARGQWTCSAGPLEANFSANGNKITGLATATTGGDALGYGQTAGGDLTGALPNATVQTVLNGKVPVYAGQTNPQFQTYTRPFVVSSTKGSPSSTSDTINKPASTLQGDMLLYYIAVQSASLTVTPPDGTWHLIKTGTADSYVTDASYYKIAGSSEPSSYSFTISTGSFGTSGMIDVRQENQSAPIDANTFFYSSGNTTSATVGAPAASQSPDLTLILLGSYNQPFAVSSPAGTAAIYLNTNSSINDAAWSYTSTPASATLTNDGTGGLWMLQQIAIAPAPFGPAAALLDGQTAATLVSANLAGTTSIAGASVSGSLVGSGSSASVSQFNVNSVLNVQNYGAVGNGAPLSHDDIGEQAAIDAACANPNGTPTTVYFPSPAKYYVNDAPLFVHCNNIRLLGPGMGSNVNPLMVEDLSAPSGPAFVFQQYTMPGVTLGTPLISGSTNSASFTGATNPYYVNLNDASSVVMGLNGASAATVDAYVKLTSTADGAIVWSSGRKAEYLVGTTAYALRIVSGQFVGQMTINGVLYGLTDTTDTLAAGTLYDVQLTYDGTTIRMFTNGVLVASSAHSGTITQPYWEVVTVGAQVSDFPDGAIQTTPINGLIDGVQISKVARHTAAFTPCNCEPTNDSNTLVVASFDQNLNMLTQLQWQDVGVQTGWSYVRKGSNAGVFGVEMDGIAVAGKKGAVGIIGQAFNGCHIRHSTFLNMTNGIYEFGNDFENVFDDVYILGGYIDFFVGGQSGLQFLTGGINLVGGLVGLRVQDSGIVAQGMVVQQQSGMVWGYSIQGDTGTDYFACSGCGLDAELGDSSWLGTLQLDNLEVMSWTGGALAAIGSSPVVEIDGGTQQGSAVFSGANFSPTGSSPEVFHVANSNLPGLASVIGPHLGTAVPWTDSPQDVVITIGASTTGLISSVTGGLSNVTPTVSSCGTGASVAAGGTSNAFVITVGSTNPTTSCAVSFGSSANFANTPVCTAQDTSQGFVLKQSALSTAGVTFTAPSAVSDMHGDTINVHCIGK